MLLRKRKLALKGGNDSTPRTLIEKIAPTKAEDVPATVGRKSPRLRTKLLPLTQPAAPKTIGRSNIVTPHSQLARLANFDVLETVVRQEKRRKQVTSPHLQTSGSTNISTLENDKQIFERPPEMLDLPEHQFPQKNLSIIDDVEAGTSLDIQETMIRNDGEQRSATDNNTSNLKLQSSRVSNTSKSLQSTPERFRRKSLNLQKILKPVLNTQTLGEELLEKVTYMKKNRRKFDSTTSVISDQDESIQSDKVVVEIDYERDTQEHDFEAEAHLTATQEVFEPGSNNLSSSGLVNLIVESSPHSTFEAAAATKSSAFQDNNLLSASDSITPIKPSENTTEKANLSVSSSTPMQNNVEDVSVETEIISASERETDGTDSPLQLSKSFLQQDAKVVNEKDVVETAVDDENPRALSETISEPLSVSAADKTSFPTVTRQTRKMKAPSLKSLNPVRKVQASKKSKAQSFLPRSQLKGILEHYSSLKFTKEALDIAEETFCAFFKQLNSDMAATAEFAGRNIIQKSDLELIMKRQRFVTEQRPLHILIEEMLPMEYREKLLPCATSKLRKLK